MLMEIIAIAVVVSLSLAVIGVFLVLQGKTMIADAISHTVLLGIVLGYFIAQSLESPLLLIGAAIVGLLTAGLIQLLQNQLHLRQDTAIGIVFPLLFSLAVLLLTRYASDVHLDTDTVFMGQLGFTIFERYQVAGLDIGPKALWNGLAILLVNAIIIKVFYKEFQLVTFDSDFAKSIGLSVAKIHYLLMTLLSISAVAAFEVFGSVLVVGVIVGPALTAYLLTHSLKKMFLLSLLLAAWNASIGVLVAYYWDISFAGTIALMTGLSFLLAYLLTHLLNKA